MSNIRTLSDNIDEEYPVAGIDNSSQGFRDNFDNIKSALAIADAEITALETTAARINSDNDFSGFNISDANQLAVTQEVNLRSDFDNDVTVQFSSGHYQIFTISADVTAFLTWNPTASTTLGTSRLAKMYIQVSSSVSGTPYNLNFVSPGNTVYFKTGHAEPFLINNNFHVFEVWKAGSSTSVFVNYIGDFTE